MLNLEVLKNRLMQIISSAVNLFVRDRAVETLRFTYIASLSKKPDGPDSDNLGLGDVYRDETSGKEYLVDDFYFDPKSEEPPRYYVQSIKEIVSRPAGETRFVDAVFEKVVTLKAADIDVQEDLIALLKRDYEKDGVEFRDRRERSTTMRGAAKPPKTATPV